MPSFFWTTSMSEVPNGLMRGEITMRFGEEGAGEPYSLVFAAEHSVPYPSRLTLRAGATSIEVNERQRPSAYNDDLRNWAYDVMA